MGHLAAKDIYRKLGKKIDGLTFRAPWNNAFHGILKTLYSADEAELLVRMPYGFSTLTRLQQVTGYTETRLRNLLDSLCAKGLVMDIRFGKSYRYTISPIVVGMFEYTMMRTDPGADHAGNAALFHEYMCDPLFYKTNFPPGTRTSVARALPYDEAFSEQDYTEVLDYEKARSVVEGAKKFAVGACSCRHAKEHSGGRSCKAPMESCTSFGAAAEYLIRHGFAREISRSEMFDNLDRSRDLGLVLSADNVQKHVSFICHCCGCCCHLLQGISRFGCENAVVTSNYIARPDTEKCTQCGKCAAACPILAIGTENTPGPRRTLKKPRVDENLCLGCGVCAVKCGTGAMKLHPRKTRVLHPSHTFERILLQCLERGTLQNFLFSNPGSLSQGFLRGFVGGFLRLPPVKKALMSEMLRSRFLKAMTAII